MRKLTGAVFQSVDGVMQAPGGPEEDPTGGFTLGGWSFAFWDQSMEQPFGKIIQAEYDLLLGKRTYDIFAGYWPYNRDIPVGERFQRINKFVLTNSEELLTWENSIRLSGDTAEAVEGLKRSEGRDLLIPGSSTLYPPLLSAGLIDRLLIMTFPVLLGKGKSIFNGTQTPCRLKMIDHFMSESGVMFSTYEPDGNVPEGSFETKAPSQEERERRSKIKAGAW